MGSHAKVRQTRRIFFIKGSSMCIWHACNKSGTQNIGLGHGVLCALVIYLIL